VSGGNQQVAGELARRLGTAVRLGRPVRSVEHDGQGVRVRTDDGIATGDAAVDAVPMAALRGLPITPPVPDRQRAAWQRSGLAHNAKLHMSVNGPVTASAVHSVPATAEWIAAAKLKQAGRPDGHPARMISATVTRLRRPGGSDGGPLCRTSWSAGTWTGS
jgi:predicted NAD/FAD-binding protein